MGRTGNALRVLDGVSPQPSEPLCDLRFRALLSNEEWCELPQAVRARFSHRLGPGKLCVYAGSVDALRMSRAGRILAAFARLIGSPFPTDVAAGAPSVVTVTENAVTGGQNWTRLYARRAARPQVIHSTKLFAGPTGLEEHVGGGIGMALVVSVEDRALLFRSRFYFLRLGPLRIPVPRWLTPGALTVTHTELGEGRFTFALDVVHPRFGELIHQSVTFQENTP